MEGTEAFLCCLLPGPQCAHLLRGVLSEDVLGRAGGGSGAAGGARLGASSILLRHFTGSASSKINFRSEEASLRLLRAHGSPPTLVFIELNPCLFLERVGAGKGRLALGRGPRCANGKPNKDEASSSPSVGLSFSIVRRGWVLRLFWALLACRGLGPGGRQAASREPGWPASWQYHRPILGLVPQPGRLLKEPAAAA